MKMSDESRVLVADDQQLVREGLHVLLSLTPDIRVVGEASDGVEAVEQAQRIKPDVVLFGEPIPQDALQEAARLAAGCRTMLVVGTSAVVAPASLLPLEAGAHGAAIIEVNPESTELTARADIVLRGRAEDVLPEVEHGISDLA